MILTVCLLAFVVAGCSGPEQKKMKFYEKGKTLYDKADYVKARLEFKNAVQIDPNFADAFYMLGMTALRTRNLKEAYGSFSKAVELKPDFLQARVELAKVLLQGGAPDRSLETIEVALQTEPANEKTLAVKAAALLVKKENQKASAILADIIQKGAKDADVFLLMSRACGQRGDIRGAEKALQDGINANPKSIMLNAALADLYVRDKRPEQAIPVVQNMITLDPANPAHKLTLASLYWDTGKEDKARELLKEVVAADKTNEEGRLRSSVFFLLKNRPGDAEQELATGIRQNEKSIKLRLALSELYVNTKRIDQAIKTLKECLTLEKDQANPNIILAKNGLAKIYLAQRKIDEAKKYVDEVLKEVPKNLDAHFLKGGIALARGEGANAVAEFRTVVNERPQFIHAYVRMAEAHAMNNELNLASDTLLNALKIDPRSRQAAIALARTYMLQKEYGKAEEQLRKMLEQNPNDLQTRAELGDLFLRKKDTARAEAEYENIKKRAPKSPAGYAKLGALFASQGKLDKARPELEQALKLLPDRKSVV
jgi:FimV-like protein